MARKSILCDKDTEPCYRPECLAHGCMDQEYEVTVWDIVEGDIVKKRWNATASEADEIREQYADDPNKSVQVEPR